MWLLEKFKSHRRLSFVADVMFPMDEAEVGSDNVDQELPTC